MDRNTTTLHSLLLLSDSALPLGSFAFSSGLESFLAHTKTSPGHHHTHHHNSSGTTFSGASKLSTFESFLSHSISNISSTALPYILAAYHSPRELERLDDEFDASTPCTVARRASVSQGRALVGIWERALRGSVAIESTNAGDAAKSLDAFAGALKMSPAVSASSPLGLSGNHGHFPPLFGAVACALALSQDETAYLFLLSHAKTVVSAAVRASVLGPYQAQAVLASGQLQENIRGCIKRDKEVTVEKASVTLPTMDLWMGRHELLYSRIFNS